MKYKTLRIHENTFRALKHFKPKYMPWDVFLRSLLGTLKEREGGT